MLIFIVICFFLISETNIAVSEEFDKTIVSSSDVDEGTSFTVTCDAERAGVPKNVTTINHLLILWNTEGIDSSDFSIYASYSLFSTPYNVTFPEVTTPARNWTFSFSGGFEGTSNRPKNRDTMRIEMMVTDAECTDIGYYYCVAAHTGENGVQRLTYHYIFVSIYTNTIFPLSMYMVPQYTGNYGRYESNNPAGSNVTLYCSVIGPQQLNITWTFGNASSDMKTVVAPFIEYDNLKQIGSTGGTLCYIYYYVASISFQTEDQYDGYTYMCQATANNEVKTVGNRTIQTKPTIVIPMVIQEGTNFTVTCDKVRAGVPDRAESILSLKLKWEDETTNQLIIAEYWPNMSFYYNPNALNLASFSTGGIAPEPDPIANIYSTYIKMSFYDAKCSHAGVYTCQATYSLQFKNEIYETHGNQNVDIFIQTLPRTVTVDPQHNAFLGPNESLNLAGSIVTLKCEAIGPKYLNFTWKINNTVEVRAVIESNISVAEPVQVSSRKNCVSYRHSSTLQFQTELRHNGYTYVCVATANFKDTIVGNMTIFVKQDSPNTTVAISHESNKIVSPGVIVEGGSITVTCDASRAGVPEDAVTISVLSIDKRTKMTTPSTTYAKYHTYRTTDNMIAPIKRDDWNFTLDGAKETSETFPKNRNTMRIQITINNTESEDTGVYFCNASYLISINDEVNVYKYQYVTMDKKDDLSFLYYVVPIVALVVVAAGVAVCVYKVRRKRAIKRRFNLKTLPAIRVESFPPSMDSNGYLLPVDPNGGYAQISDTATYSENYYSSINELDFMNEGAASDGQSDITTGLDENQAGDVDCLSDTETKTDLKFDNKMYKQLDAKSDGQVDRTVDKKLDVNMDGEIDIKTIGHVDRKTDGQLDKETDGQLDRKTDGQLDKETNGQLEKTKYVELDIKRNEGLDIKKDTEEKTSTNKPLDEDQQNESIPVDGLNDYAKLYDTPGNVFTPEVNTYVTLKF